MHNRLILGALCLLAAACNKTETAKKAPVGEGNLPFNIKGKVENQPFIYLKEVQDQGVRTLDSTRPDASGNYSFSGNIKEPGFYLLDFYGRQQTVVVLDSVPLEVNADGLKADGKLQVLGGENNRWFQKVEDMREDYMDQMQNVMQQQRSQNQNPALAQATQQLLAQGVRRRAKAMIDSMGYSIVALYATNFLDKQQDFAFLDSLAKQFKMRYPNSQLVQEFASRLDQRASVKEGMPAPELAGPNPQGQPFSLAQLRGQVVLVDFWASWCGPCRRANPAIVALHNQFKDRGFTVLGVSLDDNKDKWLAAIAKDQLNWHHISELKKWEAEAARRWQVNEIPTNFLIDQQGNIVARNLEGDELAQRVEALVSAK